MNKIVVLILAVSVLAGGAWLLVHVSRSGPPAVPANPELPVPDRTKNASSGSSAAATAVAARDDEPRNVPPESPPAEKPVTPTPSAAPAVPEDRAPLHEPGTRLTGVVKNAMTGQPVEGAVVEARNRNHRAGKQVTTNAAGRYEVTGVTSAFRYIRVKAEGFDARIEPVKIEPGQTGDLVYDFELQPRALVTGQVVGPDGEPVEGARIDTSFALFRRQLKKKPLAVSDARGFFAVHVYAGPFRTRRTIRLYARKSGLAPTQTEALAVRPGQHVNDVVLRMGYPGQLEGRVMRDDGRHFKGVHVNLSTARTAGSPPALASHQARTRTDAEGRYRLEDLPAGTYRVTAWFGRLREVRDGVTVSARRTTTDVDFTLRTGRSIAGTVVDASGQPIKRARVEAVEETYGTRTGQKAFSLSDDDGSFQIFELTGMLYNLAVSARGFGRSELLRVAPGSDTLRVLLRKIHAVTGQVVRPDGVTPCPTFHLQTFSTYRKKRLPGITRTVEDEEGRFALPSEALSGRSPYWIRIYTDDGLLSSLHALQIDPGVEPAPLQMVLARGAAVTGTVRGETGPLVAGARVLVRGQETRLHRYATTGSRGRFEINALPAGDYVVTATHPDWVAAGTTVTLARGQQRVASLTLAEEGGTLHVTVMGKDGFPLPGAYITLRHDGRGVSIHMHKYRKLFQEAQANRPDLSWPEYHRSIIRTDVHGRLVRRFIPEGTYQLIVSERKYEPVHRTVVVPPSGQVAVTVQLKKVRTLLEKVAPRLSRPGDSIGVGTSRKKEAEAGRSPRR